MEGQCTCVGVRDGAPASRSPSRGQRTERITSLPPSQVPGLELPLSVLCGKLSHLAQSPAFLCHRRLNRMKKITAINNWLKTWFTKIKVWMEESFFFWRHLNQFYLYLSLYALMHIWCIVCLTCRRSGRVCYMFTCSRLMHRIVPPPIFTVRKVSFCIRFASQSDQISVCR